MVISLTSSDPAASALQGYAQKEQEMSEVEEAETETSNLLPCVGRAAGGYGTRHGEASLAVGANQDGGATGTPR